MCISTNQRLLAPDLVRTLHVRLLSLFGHSALYLLADRSSFRIKIYYLIITLSLTMAAAAPPNHAELLHMTVPQQLREAEAQKLTKQIEKLSLQLKTCPEKRQQYIDRQGTAGRRLDPGSLIGSKASRRDFPFRCLSCQLWIDLEPIRLCQDCCADTPHADDQSTFS